LEKFTIVPSAIGIRALYMAKPRPQNFYEITVPKFFSTGRVLINCPDGSQIEVEEPYESKECRYILEQVLNLVDG
jgi:hypothetical protein